jgi:ComF family protein
MRTLLHRLGSDLLNLIAPALCPSCDAPLDASEHGYCAACRASLQPAPFPRELFDEIAGHFDEDSLALSAIASLYAFEKEGPVQRLVHALKYQGCFALGIEMGYELGEAIALFPEFEDAELIVPVPLHPARRRMRGYNQAEAIAAGMAKARRLRVLPDALARTRHTPSQTALTAKARAGNVFQAFKASVASIRDRSILLCDDVCTTGATLNTCAETLLAAGARRVAAATIAKDLLLPRAVPTSLILPEGLPG